MFDLNGKYVIFRPEIGRGSFSKVYKDKDKNQTQLLNGAKKFNDLRMYLKPSLNLNSKKDFYSEAKRRQ